MFRGRLWPDGTFGVGVERRIASPNPVPVAPITEEQRVWLATVAIGGVNDAVALKRWLDWNDKRLTSYESWASEVEPCSPSNLSIILSESTNSHRRAKRGLKGLSSYGRKMIRSGATLLEEKYGRDRLTFGTLTVPHQDLGHWRDICSNWSDIVRRFFQEVARRLQAVGLPREYVYCVELQEGRFERYGVPGLHVHFVVPNVRVGVWTVDADWCRELWLGLLNSYIENSGTSLPRSCRVQLETVKKSCAAYLSKYLSKGADAINSLQSRLGAGMIPPSWWGSSIFVKKAVLSRIIRLNETRSLYLFRLIDEAQVEGRYRSYDIDVRGRTFTVGWYGWVRLVRGPTPGGLTPHMLQSLPRKR